MLWLLLLFNTLRSTHTLYFILFYKVLLLLSPQVLRRGQYCKINEWKKNDSNIFDLCTKGTNLHLWKTTLWISVLNAVNDNSLYGVFQFSDSGIHSLCIAEETSVGSSASSCS